MSMFILKAIARDGQQIVEARAADGAQAGLCIGQPAAVQQGEHRAGGAVAKAGAEGDAFVLMRKIARAQQKLRLFFVHRIGQQQGIVHRMLPVRVGGDHACEGGMVADIGNACAQRLPLAAIDLVLEHHAALPRGERIKNRIVLGGGAVVDDDDLAKICRQQRVYINGKPLVRLQGGNQNA